jgi:hypothetical protein
MDVIFDVWVNVTLSTLGLCITMLMDFLWGFAMDSITFARQSFLEACKSLVVACE